METDRLALNIRDDEVRINIRTLSALNAAQVISAAFSALAQKLDHIDLPSDLEGDRAAYAALSRISSALMDVAICVKAPNEELSHQEDRTH